MLITKDFVFIHMPKTGGTFIHGVFKNVIEKLKKEKAIVWYLNRVFFRLNLVKPIYQKLDNIEYNEFPNKEVSGQHAGAAFIPDQYSKLPIFSVKRDPVSKFESAYYYRWWERFPNLDQSQLLSIFPHYPKLSMEEYFELVNDYEMPHFFESDYREDIGILSWQFIRMYSKNPNYVYKNITINNLRELKSEYFFEVKFCEMENLGSEFKELLKNTRFSKYSMFFDTKKRIYPPGSNPNPDRKPMDVSLLNRFKEKEWLLYEFFPEYNL